MSNLEIMNKFSFFNEDLKKSNRFFKNKITLLLIFSIITFVFLQLFFTFFTIYNEIKPFQEKIINKKNDITKEYINFENNLHNGNQKEIIKSFTKIKNINNTDADFASYLIYENSLINIKSNNNHYKMTKNTYETIEALHLENYLSGYKSEKEEIDKISYCNNFDLIFYSSCYLKKKFNESENIRINRLLINKENK